MHRIILFALALTLLTACSAAPQADLFGDWQLISYGDQTNPTPAMPGVDTTISFTGGQVGGNVGCNSFGGEYTLSGEAITFEALMSTEMYCEATWAQEAGVLGILGAGKLTIQLEGDVLRLTTADGSALVLSRKARGY